MMVDLGRKESHESVSLSSIQKSSSTLDTLVGVPKLLPRPNVEAGYPSPAHNTCAQEGITRVTMWAYNKAELGRYRWWDRPQDLAGQNGHESLRNRSLELTNSKCEKGQGLARCSGPAGDS